LLKIIVSTGDLALIRSKSTNQLKKKLPTMCKSLSKEGREIKISFEDAEAAAL